MNLEEQRPIIVSQNVYRRRRTMFASDGLNLSPGASIFLDVSLAKDTGLEPRLSYMVARLDRLLRSRLGDALVEFDLSVPQYTVLSVLRRRSGLSNAQLARRSYVTPQAMHQILTSLESKGLVERETSADHGQVRLAALTSSGMRILDECAPVVDALEAEVFAGLSASDRQTLRVLIERSL